MLSQLDAADLPADAVEVGRIGDAWGIKGWFKVLPFSGQPEALFSSKRWYVVAPDKGARNFDGTRLLKLREAKDHSGGVVAQALRGARVFVPRSSFPSTAPDEYYWIDLIGLEVVNREGEVLGRVTELLQTAAQAVMVMEYVSGEETAERMIPFVAAHVDGVDLAGKRISVNWQSDY